MGGHPVYICGTWAGRLVFPGSCDLWEVKVGVGKWSGKLGCGWKVVLLGSWSGGGDVHHDDGGFHHR